MLDQQITTILFDLDGTLLPMDQKEFTNTYFALLCKAAAPYGYESKPLVDAVWQGTKAMIKNDGSQKNHIVFWKSFSETFGEQALSIWPEFDRFYAEGFHEAKGATGENPLAKRAVKGLKEMGYQVALATNPVFPLVGVRTRLSWLGLSPEDFSLVTTYENSSFCKPNSGYYREILQKLGKKPQECLMVGNDGVEDMAAADLGIPVYLITDCLENPQGLKAAGALHGSFLEFLAFAGIDGGTI